MRLRAGLFILIVLLSSGSAMAQHLNFRQFSIESGLARSSVYALCQDDFGYLWVGLDGGGVAQFDGYEFKTFDVGKGLPSQYVRAVLQDSKGNMWFGTTEGLAFYNHKELTTIALKNGVTNQYIRCLAEGENGMIWIGTDKGVNIYGGDSIKILNRDNGLLHNRVRVMQKDHLGRMWVGTDDGISVFSGDTILTYSIYDGLPNGTVLELFEDKAGTMWVGTKFGLAAIHDGRIDLYSESDGLINSRIRAIAQDRHGNIWIGTREGVSKFNGRRFFNYTERNGLSNDRIRDIILDDFGNLWFASFFGGLNKYSGDDFVTYSSSDGLPVDQVFGITGNTHGEIILGTFNGVSIIKTAKNSVYGKLVVKNYGVDQGLSGENVFVSMVSKDNYYWFGTNFGISIMKDDSIWNIGPGDGLTGLEVHSILQVTDSTYLVGTSEGLSKIVFRSPHDFRVITIPANFTYENGKIVSALAKDKSGRCWVGFRDGRLAIYEPSDQKSTDSLFLTMPGLFSQIHDIVGMQVKGNVLWVATDGSGLFKILINDYSDDQLMDSHLKPTQNLKIYNKQTGLSSDHIYSVVIDREGSLWLGSEKGIDHVHIHSGHVESIHNYNKHHGILGVEINENSGYMDLNGNLWFGTVKGVVFIDVSKSHEARITPRLHLTEMSVLGKDINWSENADVRDFSARFGVPLSPKLAYYDNSISFQFVGINLSSPEGVRYKWKLENFEKNWSLPTTRRTVSYTNLPPGKYVFKVMSCNEDGRWNKTPQTIQFTILKPFWKKLWFLIVVICVGIFIIYLIFQWRVRRLTKAKQRLEKQVAIATKELRKEKEVVDIKNREIEKQRDALSEYNKSVTDSINYAQRIQNAIMRRKTDEGSQLSSKMFVFYKPKDIVSGDFYWYTEKENRTYLAAADCTGHGVPGAFMSMIGITYLNQILNKGDATETDEILNMLRIHIINALKNEGGEQTKDGMDIALCRIDWKSKMVQFSGANNPLYLVRNKELIETKGDKMPIGEHDRQATPFNQHQFPIKKGDMLYIFSDGYADQFGGDGGKKYLYRRFKELLVSISDQDLQEQKRILISEFDEWRFDHDQVDDILVMGLRI